MSDEVTIPGYDRSVPAFLAASVPGCACAITATEHQCRLHPSRLWCGQALVGRTKTIRCATLCGGGLAGWLGHLAVVHGISHQSAMRLPSPVPAGGGNSPDAPGI